MNMCQTREGRLCSSCNREMTQSDTARHLHLLLTFSTVFVGVKRIIMIGNMQDKSL